MHVSEGEQHCREAYRTGVAGGISSSCLGALGASVQPGPPEVTFRPSWVTSSCSGVAGSDLADLDLQSP